MGAKNEGEALDYIPPAGLGTNSPNAAKSVAVTAASSTAQDTGAAGGVIGVGGTYITFFFVRNAAEATPADVLHLRFGDSAVGAAAVTDMPFPAGQYVSWWCGPGMSFFRAIATTATSAGTLYWWKSNQ